MTATAADNTRQTAVELDVDWQNFLGRHDMVLEQLPCQWNEGAFLGNGQLGLMVYGTLAGIRPGPAKPGFKNVMPDGSSYKVGSGRHEWPLSISRLKHNQP